MSTMDELLNAIQAVPAGPPGPQGPAGPAGGGGLFSDDPLFAGVNLTPMPIDIFMTVIDSDSQQILGQSVTAGYVGAIEVENATVQLGREVSIGPGGVFSGKQWEPFRVLAHLDTSLIPLMQEAAEGNELRTVRLSFVRQAPGGPLEYLTYLARDCYITNIQPLANYDLYVMELAFSCIRVEYTPPTDPPGGTLSFSWNPGTMTANCPP
jgi:type VI protein secretion system component Hcp